MCISYIILTNALKVHSYIKNKAGKKKNTTVTVRIMIT